VRRLGVGSAGRVGLDSGQDASPLGAHGCVADAVETEDEQTLEVDENHEQSLQHRTNALLKKVKVRTALYGFETHHRATERHPPYGIT